jgi:hypothetical protein
MAKELATNRKDPFAAMNKAAGLVVFRGSIYHAEGGDIGVYYLEGSDDPLHLPEVLKGGDEFVTWFSSTLESVHDHDFRREVPSPLVGKPWDWVLGGPNPVIAPLYNEVVTYFGDR